MKPSVIAVSRSESYTFSKPNQSEIVLIAGYGVEGDVHAGKTVKHRYLMNKDATRPNLRQVHLIEIELLKSLNEQDFSVFPGQLGENITTRGLNLLELPTGTKLQLGVEAVVQLTALRNPCHQIDDFQKGLLKVVLDKDDEGNLVRKAGVMGIVLSGGRVRPEDKISVTLPPEPHRPLEYVW